MPPRAYENSEMPPRAHEDSSFAGGAVLAADGRDVPPFVILCTAERVMNEVAFSAGI